MISMKTAVKMALLVVVTVGVAAGDEPVPVVPDGMPARQPQVAVGEDGKVYVVYGSGSSIYCSVSTDAGKSFGKPVEIGKVPAIALGKRRGPRVAVAHGTVAVTAVGGEVGRGKDGDVLAWRSSEGGATWQGPTRVNDVTSSAREGLHAMAAGPEGELFSVWLDLRNRKTELFGAASRDGGATWSANQLVYRSPDGSICECCHPSATFDGKGRLYVMWRNQLAGARDMYLVESSDCGEHFSKAVKLGEGTWPLDACPMDGGALAAPASGQVATVWMRNRQVFRSSPGHDEQRLGPGEQPWAAAGPKGAFFVWTARRTGDLLLLTPDSNHPRKLAEGATDPVIAGPLNGNGPVIAVWESGHHGKSTIVAARAVAAK